MALRILADSPWLPGHLGELEPVSNRPVAEQCSPVQRPCQALPDGDVSVDSGLVDEEGLVVPHDGGPIAQEIFASSLTDGKIEHAYSLAIRRQDAGAQGFADTGYRAAIARDKKLLIALEKMAESTGRLQEWQLGRMMIQEAIDYNLNIAVMDPDPQAPCKPLVEEFVQGDLTNYQDVLQFGKGKDILTIEIENVNTTALADLEKQGVTVYPQPHVIKLIQNKVAQKQFYKTHNIPTADFIEVSNREAVAAEIHRLPFVNKRATDGYDGRGVQIMRTVQDVEKAFDAPGLIESLIPFEKEKICLTC